MSTDYLCEQKLQQTDPMLHRRFTGSVERIPESDGK